MPEHDETGLSYRRGVIAVDGKTLIVSNHRTASHPLYRRVLSRDLRTWHACCGKPRWGLALTSRSCSRQYSPPEQAIAGALLRRKAASPLPQTDGWLKTTERMGR
jgi:hypothetical protein